MKPSTLRDLDAVAEVRQLFTKAITSLSHPQPVLALAQSLYYAELAAVKLNALQPTH